MPYLDTPFIDPTVGGPAPPDQPALGRWPQPALGRRPQPALGRWPQPTLGRWPQPTLGRWPPGTLDVVLAAPKSVSVCYTALLVEWCGGAAHMLLEGHYAAISTALRYLNQEAAWAVIEPDRGGAPALGESTGLRVIQLAHIAANDDPARPPHVHTHLYVDPQVTAMEDGLEHRLDLTMFRRGLVAAVAVYDGALHGELTRSLGVRFEDTAGVRRCELVGVFPELICEFAGTACRPDRSVPQLLGMDFIPPRRVPA